MFDFFDDCLDAVVNKVDRFIEDPIGETVDTAVNSVVQPVVDTVDVAEGLLEGEVRTDAAARLAVDAAGGAVVNELFGTD